MPEVRASSGDFGKTVKLGNLPAGIPITGIAGDQQAALFGQACFEPGTVKSTYGTGCFLLLNTGKKRLSSENLITTIGCDLNGKPAYALEGAIFIAGAAIQWLRDQLNIIINAKDSEKMATAVPDNEGVYFVPALVGLGAPYWDQDARGAIYGITRGTNRNHLVRAALEAMAYQTKDVLVEMQKVSKLSVSSLKIDGGAVANNFLCQFLADLLDLNIVRPRIIETTSLGAAYLAGLAIGYWQSTAEIKKCWCLDKTFKRKINKQVADRYYQSWLAAVKRTLS
jgi:glycerol kinase